MKTSTLKAFALTILITGSSAGCTGGQPQTMPPQSPSPSSDLYSMSPPPTGQSAASSPEPTRTDATATASKQETPVPIVATPTATTSNDGPPARAADWTIFTDSSKSISFDIPTGWTAEERTRSGEKGRSIRVFDGTRTPVAVLETEMNGFGGACGPGSLSPYKVLVSVPMTLPSSRTGSSAILPRFVFRVMSLEGKFYGSYGITDSVGGTDGTACMIYNLVSASPMNGYMFGDSPQIITTSYEGIPPKVFPSLQEAQAYVAGAQFGQVQRMITSLHISF